MAWNQPDEQQGKPRGGGAPPPAGDSLLRRLRQRWASGPQARAALSAMVAAAAAVVWLASGWYQVGEGERGILQRFGAYAGVRASGVGWHLPWPIETLTVVNIGRINSAEFQARMFTADIALVNIAASIQYQVQDPKAALFAVRDPDALVRILGEAAARELVGQRRLMELIGGAARAPLSLALQSAVQQPLDAMGSGLRVIAVNLTDVNVPEAVLAAKNDLVQAGEERELKAREAQGYAADLVPAAQGQAQRARLEAEAYKLQVIGVAEGDAARFDPLLAVYARAPEVTRNRLYIETIEAILARSRKIIIDGKGGGNSLVLPLDKLVEPGVLRAAGVTGVIGGAAGAAAVAPTAATSGAAAAAGGAAAAAGGAASAAAAAADNDPRDDRGRERGERH